MPTGSFTPSWSSTTNSCGRTWRISRSVGSATARAASSTRSTSPAATSRLLTATTPWLLNPLMWLPAEPATTLRISHPAISSASSTALRMASTVASMLTTMPFCKPGRRRGADAGDLDAVSGHLGHDDADLEGADVEPDHELIPPGHLFTPPPRLLAGTGRGKRRAQPHDHLVFEEAAHLAHLGRPFRPQGQHAAEPVELAGRGRPSRARSGRPAAPVAA